MNSYNKLAKLRDETEFILKTKARNLQKQVKDPNKDIAAMATYALMQLKELIELYEID